jgi:hypothetical protein
VHLCLLQGWSEVMAGEVLENCHKTISASYVALGQSMGQTLLPQPPANMLVRTSHYANCQRHAFSGSIGDIIHQRTAPCPGATFALPPIAGR